MENLVRFIHEALNMEVIVAFLTNEDIYAVEQTITGTFLKFIFGIILLVMLVYFKHIYFLQLVFVYKTMRTAIKIYNSIIR